MCDCISHREQMQKSLIFQYISGMVGVVSVVREVGICQRSWSSRLGVAGVVNAVVVVNVVH